MTPSDVSPREVNDGHKASNGETDPKPEVRRPRRRSGQRPALILIVLVLATALGAGIWTGQVPTDLGRFIDGAISAATGRLSPQPPPADQDSSLPNAVQVETTGAATHPSDAGQEAESPFPDTGKLFELVADRLDSQGNRLDELAATVNEGIPDLAARLDGMRDEIGQLSDAVRGQEVRLGELDLSVASIRDRAEAAGREASHVRNQLDLINSDSDSSSEMLKADLKAVITSLDNVRAQQFNLSGRIEALAGDLHLMSRYGYGQQANRPPQQGAVVQTAPGRNLLSAPSGHSHAPPPSSAAPPDLVQGRYRVGDWVGRHGVVSSIRKTPEGDHLVTPGGVLFAPAVPGPEGDGGGG